MPGLLLPIGIRLGLTEGAIIIHDTGLSGKTQSNTWGLNFNE
jgi:hypothetical protein